MNPAGSKCISLSPINILILLKRYVLISQQSMDPAGSVSMDSIKYMEPAGSICISMKTIYGSVSQPNKDPA